MSEGDLIYLCEGCHKEVVPGAFGVVRAVPLVPAPTTEDPGEVVEGLDVYFHDHCFIGEQFFRLKPPST
jgi:hypothetical protein